MSLDSDAIVDRRRMRRKLTFWRVVAIAIAIVAVLAGAGLWTRSDGLSLAHPGQGYVARVKLSGLIRNDQDRTESLDRLAQSRARAVIVHVDSPGGTTAGSEQLHQSIRRLAARKPTVVVVDGLAASGGYIAALGADHIIAQGTSLVGSIGVLFQYPNVTDLMKTLGVQMESVRSSPLKAAPSGLEPTSPEARAAIEALVKDSYGWFRGLVQQRRGLDDALLERVADGRVFTGRQAIELRLVDALGDERSAREWLAKEKGVEMRTPVRDWRLRSRLGDLSFLHMAAAWALDAMGLTSLAHRVESWGAVQAIERLNLDGLLALWHPPVLN
jgi:protease-4